MRGSNAQGAEWPQQLRGPDSEDFQEFGAGTSTLQNQTPVVYQTKPSGFTALAQSAPPDREATL